MAVLIDGRTILGFLGEYLGNESTLPVQVHCRTVERA